MAHSSAVSHMRPTVATLPVPGNVLVAHSPANTSWNHHVGARQQRFAYDLDVIDDDGRLFTGDGSRLEQWVGFGREIRAPFNGTVVRAVDGLPDLTPGATPDLSVSPVGNHVLLRLDDGRYAYLAHMKRGSVRQALLGERISRGTLLGALGNSGNTSAPHLHIHVQRGRELYGKTAIGMPLAFQGYEQLAKYEFDPQKGFTDPSPRDGRVTSPTVPRRAK